jgi:hypothetical protein
LQQQYPFLKFTIGTNFRDLFQHNGWRMTHQHANGHIIQVGFGSNGERGVSYPLAAVRKVSGLLGVPIKFTPRYPIINVRDDEPKWEFTKPYIVICSGHKQFDGGCKFWGTANYQTVVDALHKEIDFIQVGEMTNDHMRHTHPKLNNVIDLRGQTMGRGLLRLVSSPLCFSTLSGVTLLHWLGTCQNKLTYTVANSREHKAFVTASPLNRIYFAEKGTYDCPLSACYRNRVKRLNDGDVRDNANSLCLKPVSYGGETVPACALAIKPEQIINDIRKDLHERR